MTKPCRPCRGVAGLTEANWDERKQECCKKRNVGDIDPGKHSCASVPDLTRLDWPPVRLGWFLRSDLDTMTLPRGCPHVELAPNEPAPKEAELFDFE